MGLRSELNNIKILTSNQRIPCVFYLIKEMEQQQKYIGQILNKFAWHSINIQMKQGISNTHQSTLKSNKQNVADVGQLSVKVKREKTTYFLLCKPLETIDSLKRKIVIFHKGLEVSDIRLYIGTRLIDDKSNVHDQDIRNNSLIYYKLKKGNAGEWEEFPDLGI